MPLAKALSYDSALQVLDGTRPATVILREEDEKIVKFLSKNQENVIEKLKSMQRFT